MNLLFPLYFDTAIWCLYKNLDFEISDPHPTPLKNCAWFLLGQNIKACEVSFQAQMIRITWRVDTKSLIVECLTLLTIPTLVLCTSS